MCRLRIPFFRLSYLVVGLFLFAGCGGATDNDSTSQVASQLSRNTGRTSEPVRIMMLGDSITEGNTKHSSYRRPLWHLLVNNGFNVDFVGDRSSAHNGPPPHNDFDRDHEAVWGWRTDEILGLIDGASDRHHPDIAVIHLGTNDLFQGEDIPGTIWEIEEIITHMRLYNPFTQFVVAQIIPNSRSGRSTIEAFNSEIAAMAMRTSLAESPVHTVDLYSGFWVSSDTFDGVHPNDSGEHKMSGALFNKIVEILTTPAVLSDAMQSPSQTETIESPSPTPVPTAALENNDTSSNSTTPVPSFGR